MSLQQQHQDGDQALHLVIGQTATGKTSYALNRARGLSGELINMDARQAYRGISIVSGKDIDDGWEYVEVAREKAIAIGYHTNNPDRIWLYDMVSLHETISSQMWMYAAGKTLQTIYKNGRVPIIVGGTVFYADQLLRGGSDFHVPPDPILREKCNKLSSPELFSLLTEIAPDVAHALNHSERSNPQRLIRRIEIAHHSGGKSNAAKELTLEPMFAKTHITVHIFFHPSADDTKKAITHRVKDRLLRGAVGEIEHLLRIGNTTEDPGMQALGCREIATYIRGHVSYDDMVDLWITRETQYAKRQKTFVARFQKVWSGHPRIAFIQHT